MRKAKFAISTTPRLHPWSRASLLSVISQIRSWSPPRAAARTPPENGRVDWIHGPSIDKRDLQLEVHRSLIYGNDPYSRCTTCVLQMHVLIMQVSARRSLDRVSPRSLYVCTRRQAALGSQARQRHAKATREDNRLWRPRLSSCCLWASTNGGSSFCPTGRWLSHRPTAAL